MSSSTNPASNSSSKTSKSSKIEKIIFGGSGLTRENGCVIFVPFSAPGDEVTLKVIQEKKRYKIAQIQHLLTPGQDRVSPRCPHFQKCGGCQLQHLSYKAQLQAKQSFAQETLDLPVEIVPAASSWNYRSHLRFNLKKKGKGFQFGFIGIDNHTLVEIQYCPLFLEDPEFFSALKSYLASLPNHGIQSGSFRLFKTKQHFTLAFSFYPKLPSTLLPFPLAQGTAFKSPKKEVHLGTTQIPAKVLGLPVQFSPYGFMQNNLSMSEHLYQTTLDWIGTAPKKILDLYCGVGITSTLLAQRGHTVIGVDSNKATLKKNSSAHFICNSVEHVLPKLLESFQPDVILVNPPRTGLSKEVRLLLNAPQLLYISCMPPTLKRDLEDLKNIYTLKEAKAFDMFPQTTHVEILTNLTKIADKK